MKSGIFIHTPESPLSQFVESIWIVKGNVCTSKIKILPDGISRLFFNLSRPFKIFDESDPRKTKMMNSRSWIGGIYHNHLTIQTEKETDLIVVGFKPGAAYSFFRIPISEFADQVIESELVNCEIIKDTVDKLYESPNRVEKIQVIETMLFQYLFYKNYPDQFLINRFSNEYCYDAPSLNALIENVGYSHKHAISIFKKYVGTSPKKFYRLYRFRKILQAATHQEQLNWTDLGYQLGYYDQSHLISDFKQFSGLTPKQYPQKRTFNEILCSTD